MTDFRSIEMNAALFDYVVAHSSQDPIYEAIRTETEATTGSRAGMQIGADQFALLTMMTRMVGARFAIEVGTFTGTSAVAIAKGLEEGGQLVCCDINEEWTAIARRHWAAAGVADRIDLRIAPALDTIAALEPDRSIDLAFIDADKSGYTDYYDALVPRIRSGGLLIADNTLWSGRVADSEVNDTDTEAIRRFNDRAAVDDRCEVVVLAIGDGVTLCRKR
jgi:caffeoyl-CoA O-methyltransferase